MAIFSLIKTAFATRDYYKAMNAALKTINGDYHMLHYPFYMNETDSFSQAQDNLLEYCIDKFSSLEGKDLLDIGCGNGIGTLYVAKNHPVKSVTGVDINAHNVEIANYEKHKRNIKHAIFIEGNAQNLSIIKSNSIDLVINIESAFHYPQKDLFINEIGRVLKPGGQFLIADILTTTNVHVFLKRWKRRMNFHHWYLPQSQEAFKRSNLSLLSNDDVTDKVIQGFEMYKNYFGQFSKNGSFQDWLLKLFFVINVKLNIRLLKKKRSYNIFFGEKVL
jgi:ubiquinone/menaquinone biosynthesis C-methylase UbiE